MQCTEEDQLAKQRLFAVEPALFWHITNAAAVIVIDWGVIEVDLARVFGQHTKCNAHGGGFSGAVGSDETEDFAVTNAKGHIPQGLSLPEGLIEVVNGQGGHVLVLRVLVEGQCVADSGQRGRDEVAKEQVVASSKQIFGANSAGNSSA